MTLAAEYDRLVAREVEAAQTLAGARGALETARAKDVAAIAQAARRGKSIPDYSQEERARDVVASSELLLAGLELALAEIEAEIGREIEQARHRKITIESLHVETPHHRLTGESLVSHITAYFERSDENYRRGQEWIAQRDAYDAAVEAVELAKEDHRRAGRPPETYQAEDYVSGDVLMALNVPGGFGGRLREHSKNIPMEEAHV
jgi:hypothetical protein